MSKMFNELMDIKSKLLYEIKVTEMLIDMELKRIRKREQEYDELVAIKQENDKIVAIKKIRN